MSTGTRYVGAYYHGEMKLRGIEARRRDTPKFIKNMQNAMLERMQRETTYAGIQQAVPELLSIAREYIRRIEQGTAPPLELVLKRSLSKEAQEYMNNSVSAVVSRMLEESGVHLAAGESVSYIMIDSTGKKKPEKAKPLSLYAVDDGYDIAFYADLAMKAVETLLSALPYADAFLRELGGEKTNIAEPVVEIRKREKKRPVPSLAADLFGFTG
jgi:DNA polymerase elongation subunit (family B)